MLIPPFARSHPSIGLDEKEEKKKPRRKASVAQSRTICISFSGQPRRQRYWNADAVPSYKRK